MNSRRLSSLIFDLDFNDFNVYPLLTLLGLNHYLDVANLVRRG